MSVDMQDHARSMTRPRAVTFVAWLIIGEAFLMVGLGVLAFAGAGWLPWLTSDTLPLPLDKVVELTVLGIVAESLGIFALIVAIGLLRLSPWSWLVAMTLQGVSLAISLIARFIGNADDISLIVGVIVVMMLNQREVRGAFERRGRPRV